MKSEGCIRGYNLAYKFTVNGQTRKICKTSFTKALDIGDKFIRNPRKKLNSSGALEKEMGRLKHINSHQRIESHYHRAQISREYLEGNLTVAEMYRKPYIRQKKMYKMIFLTEFKISFFKPKKDQCSLCESYKNINEVKEKRMQQYEYHIHQKELSRTEKHNDMMKSKNERDTLA
ncbi:hypothetical protein PR048_015648 [Dryococelus australis]|uniref:Uncharacterized protein n=1 Tax=Dryococelus australis TaxID=614101 RepID=A0ABQ9HIK6_9NEOP|nr:hypothetical protein PR048_015648 [Dryococelus australis]